MMRRMLVLAVAAGLLFIPVPSEAATVEVEVGGTGGALVFVPDSVAVKAGDTVQWNKNVVGPGLNTHNVSSDNGLFRSGEPTAGAFVFSVVFSAGTFPYRCQQHPDVMTGEVRVRPKILKKPKGLPFTVRWATKASGTTELASVEPGDWVYDVQFKVGSGKWRNWKKDTSQVKGVFGKKGKPVKVKKGKVYRFRARTQDAGNASMISGWSPVARFKAKA